ATTARPAAPAIPGGPLAPPPAQLPQAADPAAARIAGLWASLGSFPLDEGHLDRNRIITASRHDPAHVAFDLLRTRTLHALAERGWTRIAVTSPTKGCGKTFTAANLGISLARREGLRAVVLDLDMRHPNLHRVFGVPAPGRIGDMLRGGRAPEEHLRCIGPNAIHAGRQIAFGFNEAREPYAAELLQDPRSRAVLDDIQTRLAPDVMLFDLPPALVSDDVLALRPAFDAVLLVIGGGITTETQIREVEHRLGSDVPLLGIVLNKAEGSSARKYAY
ncbi:CpsD/CapB family tyrosine-protein kinase, partial [Roseivivax sp. CAU 1761]